MIMKYLYPSFSYNNLGYSPFWIWLPSVCFGILAYKNLILNLSLLSGRLLVALMLMLFVFQLFISGIRTIEISIYQEAIPTLVAAIFLFKPELLPFNHYLARIGKKLYRFFA